MTEARAGNRGSGRAAQRRPRQGNPVSRLFQSLGLFISQIIDDEGYGQTSVHEGLRSGVTAAAASVELSRQDRDRRDEWGQRPRSAAVGPERRDAGSDRDSGFAR